MSRYTVYVIPSAWREIKDLPGYLRQRVKRAIEGIADDPAHPAAEPFPSPKSTMKSGGSG